MSVLISDFTGSGLRQPTWYWHKPSPRGTGLVSNTNTNTIQIQIQKHLFILVDKWVGEMKHKCYNSPPLNIDPSADDKDKTHRTHNIYHKIKAINNFNNINILSPDLEYAGLSINVVTYTIKMQPIGRTIITIKPQGSTAIWFTSTYNRTQK